MIFEENDRIVFMGDSVTDFGRKRPCGEGLHEGSGTGYVRLLDSFFNAFYPELNLRITNMGVSGNNILNLLGRWQSDALDLNPDWVVVCIGINDVWRQFDSPYISEENITPEVYEKTYREIIEKTKDKVKGIILMTPYYMEPLKEDMMRKCMDIYTEIVKKLAKEYGLLCVDLQSVFDEYLKVRHSSYITWDRVHPNQTGALLIANEFMRVVGFEKYGK